MFKFDYLLYYGAVIAISVAGNKKIWNSMLTFEW